MEKKVGAMFPSQHPVTAWLVEHASDVLSKYLVGSDDHIAFEKLYDKPVREEGLEFREGLLPEEARQGYERGPRRQVGAGYLARPPVGVRDRLSACRREGH